MELLRRPEVADPGIDESIKKLTAEQIEQTVNKVLSVHAGRLNVYVQTCMHCGLCSNACHYCLSHDGDPTYSPVGKAKNTIWEMLRKKGKRNTRAWSITTQRTRPSSWDPTRICTMP